jgi:hypothetical protein
LLPLAEQDSELAEVSFPRVDELGCVRMRTNLYSTPAPPGKTVEVRLYPSHVEIRDEGRLIARHERCYERHQQLLALEHYLDVPGAQTGRVGRLQAAGGVAGGRTVAGELRSVARPAYRATRAAQRHAPDDPGAEPYPSARPRAGARGGEGGDHIGLRRCRRGPPFSRSRRSDPCARCAHRARCPGAL